MLGVGLHSYGFMDKAFWWLAGFMVSQLLLMAIAGMPLERWRSFATSAPPARPGPRLAPDDNAKPYATSV